MNQIERDAVACRGSQRLDARGQTRFLDARAGQIHNLFPKENLHFQTN